LPGDRVDLILAIDDVSSEWKRALDLPHATRPRDEEHAPERQQCAAGDAVEGHPESVAVRVERWRRDESVAGATVPGVGDKRPAGIDIEGGLNARQFGRVSHQQKHRHRLSRLDLNGRVNAQAIDRQVAITGLDCLRDLGMQREREIGIPAGERGSSRGRHGGH
jgi:hypothetical protein